ncbi:MAG: VWA domain-containing protein [Deltaproteobacteria bacterium]|nr:VWA domain-containing protein [Deltaproteobacteria bacterium]
MIFTGISFSFLLKIFGIFGGMIGLLYLLKLRERFIPVSAHFLWERVLKSGQRSLLSRILRRFFSFLLQLFLLSLVVLTMGNPKEKEATIRVKSILVLLDTSASMKALDIKKGDEYISRFEYGVEKVKKIINSKKEKDEMMIVTFSSQTVPRTPWESNQLNLLGTLEKLAPNDTPSNFEGTLHFVSQILHNRKNSDILIVSDGAVGKIPQVITDKENTKCLKVGEKIDLSGHNIYTVPVRPTEVFSNIAITSLAARPLVTDPDTGELLVTILNSGQKELKTRLDIYVDGNWRESRNILLGPSEEKVRLIRIPLVGKNLEARIKSIDGGYDPLDSDNTAYAVLPLRPDPKILLVSRENLFLEAALLLLPGIMERVNPEEYNTKSPDNCGNEKCNILIFNDFVPDKLPDTKNQYYINPAGKPFDVSRTLNENLMIMWTGGKTPHPIMKSVSMKDVNLWGYSSAFKVNSTDVSLMQIDARGTVLGILRTLKDGRRLVATGFSLKDSDFSLQVSFPVFILNMVNWFLGTSHTFLATYSSGKMIEVYEDAEQINRPDGKNIKVKSGRQVFNPLLAGIYRFMKKGKPVREIAVSLLDETESDIRFRETSIGCEKLEIYSPSEIIPKKVSGKSIPWKLLLLLLLTGIILIIMGYVRGALGAFSAFSGVTIIAISAFYYFKVMGYPMWIALSCAILVVLFLEWITYNRRITV